MLSKSIPIPLTFSHFAKSQPSMYCIEYCCPMIIGQKIMFGSHVTRAYSTILLRPANRPDFIAFIATLSLRPGFWSVRLSCWQILLPELWLLAALPELPRASWLLLWLMLPLVTQSVRLNSHLMLRLQLWQNLSILGRWNEMHLWKVQPSFKCHHNFFLILPAVFFCLQETIY